MSDAGKAKIYSLEETTWGTTPSAAMNTLAGGTAASDGAQRQTTRSSVLRSDYVQPDTIFTQDSGALTVPFELQYGDVPMSDWLEGVARNDVTAAVTVTGTDISFTAPNTIGSVTTDLSVFPVGRAIRVAGSASNNIFDIVVASSATSITTLLGQVQAEIAGASVTIDNDGQIKPGTTLKSYTVERHFTDLSTTPFLAQKGQRPTGMTLNFPTGGLVNGSVTFGGKKPQDFAAATAGTGAANAATTTKTFSGSQHVTAIFEGGAAITAKVSTIDLNLASPVRPQFELGNLDPWGIGGNTFQPSGSINLYNNDAGAAIWNKFNNGTLTSLYFRVTRDGATYFFSLPSLAMTGGNPDIGNVDSDVMLPMAFNLDYSTTYSMQWAVDRFAAS